MAETWLTEVADPRVHGTTGRVVAEAFSKEREFLLPLPPVPFDTSYVEERIVAWDAYVEVCGNRYAVPDDLCGRKVLVNISLDGTLKVFSGDKLVATHTTRPLSEGWVTVPAFHRNLWAVVLSVEKRPLSVYEEVTG